MLIKILKSYDMWEEDCSGWYDIYSVDDEQVYPTNDYDFTPIPDWIVDKFDETMNGSKTSYENMILALYYDLLIPTSDKCTYDEFHNENIYNTKFLEKRLKDELGVIVDVV